MVSVTAGAGFVGQRYPFGGSTGAPKRCLGAPDLLEQRKSGLGKSYMDMDNRGCQSCLAKLVGGQVEEGVVHSREEGIDFVVAGAEEGFDHAEKEVVTLAIDMGIPLGCTDRKKAMYPCSLCSGE